MNPITLAIHGKGFTKAVQRGLKIMTRYGLSANKMDKALDQYTNVLARFDCSATLPITSVSVERYPQVVKKYQSRGIEFAIHGFRHLDHSELSYEEQKTHVNRSLDIFSQADIQPRGFRGPYLRWNGDTLALLREYGLDYDSSQSLNWEILPDSNKTYQHVLQFYGARSASHYPSLPSLEDNLVRLPYSLPDDEAMVERLGLTPDKMNDLWLTILKRTHRLGELFTIGLHPERISFCQEPLEAVLTEAAQLDPPVWIARLDEIATWWRERLQTKVDIQNKSQNEYRVTIDGPKNVTILARGVLVDGPTHPWTSSYQQVQVNQFTITATRRPFIGLAPTASESLAEFLREQGYIIEFSENRQDYAYYFDQPQFVSRHKRFLLAQIEGADFPLVRLSRWPNAARSALSITGDIDALSLWDYLLRLVGK